MRSDMAEVIIERPRSLNHYAIRRQHKKTGLRIRNYDPDNEYDDLPTHLSSSRHKQYGRAAKNMDDLLGPIDRFLHSNVGRPWDQVWSEICQRIDRRNLAKNHLFEHFDGCVETDCFIGNDGKIYAYTSSGIYEVNAESSIWFYAHPESGLLCSVDDRPRSQAYNAKKKAEKNARANWCVEISGKRHYVKLNGLWYIADIERYSKGSFSPEQETEMTLVTEGHPVFGNTWRVFNKRQCGKKELKAAGLSNDRPA
ncbi:MAG: hypothetical protein AAB401_12185 [Acidobacteriota bacterium]